ncbi:MAG: hypothetical protein [Caudoviricetes sp.]|nr:MAG: hypothetical protein [Caudoviricetes sp.]
MKNDLKSYALFGKDKDGDLFGYVEQSFSMGLSPTHARRWSVIGYRVDYSKPLTAKDLNAEIESQTRILKMLEKDKKTLSKQYPDLDFFIVRLNSKNCPVMIDWKAFHKATGKYERRNVKWSLK